MFTIVSKSGFLQNDADEIACWEIVHIPKQLAKQSEPILLYEVFFSCDSTIRYETNTIFATYYYLEFPLTVPQFLTKHKLWEDTLRHSGMLIQHYVGEKPENLCLEAVRQNGLALEHIEAPYQTEEVCLHAVHTNWESLQFVAKQSERICCKALEISGKAIQYVREPTPQLALQAIRNGGGVDFLRSMPLEICYIAVERNGTFLQYIPKEKQTEEICRVAVQTSPSAIQWVLEQTEDLCRQAVRSDGLLLRYVHEQTLPICMDALENNGSALQFVKEYMLPTICSYIEEHNIPSISFGAHNHSIWRNGFVFGATFTACIATLVLIFGKTRGILPTVR
jgi:hypothetical protein